MVDPHLNLFYCYGARSSRDEEENILVEDNLTRAFIHAIRMLSPEHRKVFLKDLFGRARHLMFSDRTEDLRPEDKDWLNKFFDSSKNIDVALQSCIPRERRPKGPEFARIVTISRGDRPCELEKQGYEYSSPDARIYDKDFCLLVECKCWAGKPIEKDQIRRHGRLLGEEVGKEWKECDWDEHIAPRLVDLTWYNVLEAINATKKGFDLESRPSAISSGRNELEKAILDELVGFLAYYGYRLFDGFELDWPWPAMQLQLRVNKEKSR